MWSYHVFVLPLTRSTQDEKTRFNIQTLRNLIKIMVISRKGCGLMSFERHIFKACLSLSVVLFGIWIFQEAPPQKLSFNFPGKMGKGFVYEPPRVYLHILARLPEGEVLCILLLCSCDQNRMYFLSSHVGCWQNGKVTPCSIFQPIKFYQLMCLSKINCCVTCCNLMFFFVLYAYLYLATPPIICQCSYFCVCTLFLYTRIFQFVFFYCQ